KDLQFDEQDRPLLLYVTSHGYESGPKNAPRTWTLARWTGGTWQKSPITTSDNNYDAGELHQVAADDWRLIAPTDPGPQAFNPGGEVAQWQSRNQGATWQKTRTLTSGSQFNHTYVRRVLNAHPDFVAIWADGHGRQPSESTLYFCNADGEVFQLPREMHSDFASMQVVQQRGR
ncbi:MAG: hypothetical protein KDA92_24730, partial [Planctomycetales bacterium]|nr:hypothetical protein [Planctomycetales bacterium]